MPTIRGSRATIRELRPSDAPALLALLATPDVARFISPPPATLEGFERFVAWTRREQAAGRSLCFGVVPRGIDAAIGIFQIRQLDARLATAEWGVALAQPFWGSGVFLDGAQLVLDFVFGALGVHRLEARAAIANARGNGALRKLGALQEGVLRESFLQNGQYLDQALWAIVGADWREFRRLRGPSVH